MEKFSGVPVWHVSVAVRGMKPVVTWSPAERLRAEELMRAVLRGIGRDVESRTQLGRTLQLRRLMTPAEALSIGGTQDRRVR